MQLVTNPASVMTNITAPPMPNAVPIFFDTPKNGHMPKIRLSTKLFTNTAPTINNAYSLTRTTPFVF